MFDIGMSKVKKFDINICIILTFSIRMSNIKQFELQMSKDKTVKGGRLFTDSPEWLVLYGSIKQPYELTNYYTAKKQMSFF